MTDNNNEVFRKSVQGNTNWIIRETGVSDSENKKTGVTPEKEPGQRTFLQKLRYAFAVEDKSFITFSEDEMKLLNKVADIVVKRRLTTPAVIFLESVRPLNFLGSQVIVFIKPIVDLVISIKEMAVLAKLLEKRNSIPLLIDLIEKREAATDAAK